MTPSTFTIEMVRRLAAERRERETQRYALVHAALFDGHDIKVVERDGTEHVGHPLLAPGSWESIGVSTRERFAWFHAAAVASVEVVAVGSR